MGCACAGVGARGTAPRVAGGGGIRAAAGPGQPRGVLGGGDRPGAGDGQRERDLPTECAVLHRAQRRAHSRVGDGQLGVRRCDPRAQGLCDGARGPGARLLSSLDLA
eukprot:3109828-Rhodomonas_salina.1